MADFQIQTRQAEGKTPITVLHIHGNVDTNTYQLLEEKARQEHANGARNLLVDLSEVDFVSSAGLRALHQMYLLFRQESVEDDETVSRGLRDGTYKSRHLKLLCPNTIVQTSLKTAGFDMYLEIFDDLEKALASFH